MQGESIIVIKWLLSNKNGKSTHHTRIGLLQEHRNLQKKSVHYPTCSRTGSGIASVICVVINPGRIALHRIPCLREREGNEHIRRRNKEEESVCKERVRENRIVLCQLWPSQLSGKSECHRHNTPFRRTVVRLAKVAQLCKQKEYRATF